MSPLVQFFFEGSSLLDDFDIDKCFYDDDAENIFLMPAAKNSRMRKKEAPSIVGLISFIGST
jgi:3-phenylpropionate/cinnamic acid dioxygenase small subunit